MVAIALEISNFEAPITAVKMRQITKSPELPVKGNAGDVDFKDA